MGKKILPKICRECGSTENLLPYMNSRICKNCHYIRLCKIKDDPVKRMGIRLSQDKWKKNNREKAAAHRTVGKALKRGSIVKPARCSRCEETKYIEAHHEDYSKRLDIIWLCKVCHKKQHHDKVI